MRVKFSALACLLALTAEGAARTALAPVSVHWRYWSDRAAVKYETYRRIVSRGPAPAIVIAGDSTGSGNIDPRILFDALNSSETFDLGTAGNLASAFRACTLPLLARPMYATPSVLVVSLLPSGFIDDPVNHLAENRIRSSLACRELRGDWAFDTTVYLTRLVPELPYRNHWWTGQIRIDPPPDRGFEGLVSTVTIDAQRRSELRALEIRLDSESRTVDPTRAVLWDELARTARQRRFALVAVVPPVRHRTGEAPRYERDYVTQLQSKGREYDFAVIDYRQASFVRAEHFYDAAHLNVEGAKLLSKDLARRLAAIHAAH